MATRISAKSLGTVCPIPILQITNRPRDMIILGMASDTPDSGRRFRVCSERPVCGMVWTMSANEVLEQVKALPPRERRKFFAHVHDLETASQAQSNSKQKRRIRRPDAAARRRRIFGDKVLPNLVLLARELERYQGKT